MVRIGIVGIGFMGRIHYLASQKLANAKVVAVCSRDRAKLAGDWTETRGNFGPEPGQVDLTGVKTYETLNAMLADPDIDLIDVCNPTDQHPTTAIAALKAGKHVLVEKAISLQPEQADEMLAAAKSAGKMLMVAHVLPFFPEFRYAATAIRGGEYGRLMGAHFKRVISKPDWSADIGDASKTGGPAIDLHIHDTHFIGLACGVPKAVFSSGVVDPSGAVTYLTTQYLYSPGGPSVTCSSGAVSMPGRSFVHGFEIYLEKATLLYDSGGPALTLLTADGKSVHPEVEGGGDPLAAFTSEIQTAVDAVAAGRESDLLSAKLARDALVLCYRECQSVKTGGVVPV
ncbi:Gfo/Idh/MocA family protein [Limnoglobus roseus]|uniref:Putative Rossmann-fold-type glycoside hydrolase n=1 Tax=Limnoglobus roseus TaxID=2598579 RepID=A0A5C1AI80_9BACT|nr:Gfo/Idh/MocA family oxidoreductase [Limnoglobus roseus]QEL17877.1 putative Rossmann-fold-type glycoside hydrolase [Limnoglobus roseus]